MQLALQCVKNTPFIELRWLWQICSYILKFWELNVAAPDTVAVVGLSSGTAKMFLHACLEIIHYAYFQFIWVYTVLYVM